MGKIAVIAVLVGVFGSVSQAEHPLSDAVDQMAEGIYEKLMADQESKVLAYTKAEMLHEKAIYSSRLFPDLKGYALVTFANKMEDGSLAVLAGGEYLEDTEKPPFEFQGMLKDKPLKAAPVGDLGAEFVPLVAGQLYLVKFLQENFLTPLPGESRAIQVLVCAVAKQGLVSGHHCRMIASSAVLGTIALEGRAEGPYYIADKLVREGKLVRQEPIITADRN